MFQLLQSHQKRSPVSFQVLSDLHLEINQQYTSYQIPMCAKYLILAGDIGRLVDYNNYHSFLQKQTDRYELVFLVLGNHEFYDESFAGALAKAKQLEQEPSFKGRLILLHQRRYDIPGTHVTILGCTLWSRIPPESRDMVFMKISDFQQIKNWTPTQHNSCFESDLAWLRGEMRSIQTENSRAKKQQAPKQSILVVTHHAPSLWKTSSPEHAKNPWRFAFGTDLLSQMPDAVNTWVFGHTHYTTDFRRRGIRVMSNQRGCVLPWSDPKDTKNNFDVTKVIHVT